MRHVPVWFDKCGLCHGWMLLDTETRACQADKERRVVAAADLKKGGSVPQKRYAPAWCGPCTPFGGLSKLAFAISMKA